MAKIVEFVHDNSRKRKKRRKCWLPAFCPFPTLFRKASFQEFLKPEIVCLRDIERLSVSMPLQFWR